MLISSIQSSFPVSIFNSNPSLSWHLIFISTFPHETSLQNKTDAPTCKLGQKYSYGTSIGETIAISCDVESSPYPGMFYWIYHPLDHGDQDDGIDEELPSSSPSVIINSPQHASQTIDHHSVQQSIQQIQQQLASFTDPLINMTSLSHQSTLLKMKTFKCQKKESREALQEEP